jgi:uncharacterized repeat protein (TIGR03843 family)
VSGDDGELPEILRHAELRILGRFTTASNATLLCSLPDVRVRGRELLAVYKPQSGERPLWDFPPGTLHLREVAAHVLDRALGWRMVPTTVLRQDAPHGPGSVQRFVEHDPARHYFTLLEEGDAAVLDQLRQMIVLDLVANNTDRKGGHVLIDDDEHIWLVDHGVCFHVEPKLRTVAWDLAGEPVPQELRAAVRALAGRLDDRHDPLVAELNALLTAEEVAATAARARLVAARRHFPAPTGPRPWPWPPI